MTVCLTGDVHHMSLSTRDQEYLDGTEVEAAIEYARTAAEYDVPVTLFCTGRALVEEPGGIRELAKMDSVELGGHNYWAFDTPIHKVSRGLLGTWNGPRLFQAWEIRKSIDKFSELGIDIRSWRDHAYRHDENTPFLLAKAGITHFSDRVGPGRGVTRDDGLTVVPINTPPDHEHVYHAFRTREFVREAGFVGPFGSESRHVQAWVDWVLERIDEIEARGDIATVLAHPSCMQLADGMSAFERLVARIDERGTTVMMREVDRRGAPRE